VLNAVSTGAFLDLNATGSAAFLYHPAFALYANGSLVIGGNAQVGGIITASSFYATNAVFNGNIRLGATSGSAFISIYESWTPPALPVNAFSIYGGPFLRTEIYSRNGIDFTTSLGRSIDLVAITRFLSSATFMSSANFEGSTYFTPSSSIGFYGAVPQTKRQVVNSRKVDVGGYLPAFESLLQALEDYGLIFDFTTA